MSLCADDAAHEDEIIVALQLGREPRRPWGVAVRCSYGYPLVLTVGPVLEDGTPFPTFFWLSCPWLVDRVSQVESAGGVAMWARSLAGDPASAERMRAAEVAYREARDANDAQARADEVRGFAGQKDVLDTKCLHAHVAARMAGIDDPVGEGVLGDVGEQECPDGRCAPCVVDAGGDRRG